MVLMGLLIVAVNSLGQEQTENSDKSSVRDLLAQKSHPVAILRARVFTFGYQSDTSSVFGSALSERILQHANTLVAELQADRDHSNAAKRAIISVCHSLGSILSKKALAYFASRTSIKVEHLYIIFISFYGILILRTKNFEPYLQWRAKKARRKRTAE